MLNRGVTQSKDHEYIIREVRNRKQRSGPWQSGYTYFKRDDDTLQKIFIMILIKFTPIICSNMFRSNMEFSLNHVYFENDVILVDTKLTKK